MPKEPKKPLKLTPLDEMGKLLARVSITPKPQTTEPKQTKKPTPT